ncbi:hypothetical protein CUZ96_1147 [Enterococcus lactis]|nr:hypothetical protein [Enterococcus lactis]
MKKNIQRFSVNNDFLLEHRESEVVTKVLSQPLFHLKSANSLL